LATDWPSYENAALTYQDGFEITMHKSCTMYAQPMHRIFEFKG